MRTHRVPEHVKHYYQFVSIVNLTALVYSITIWTKKKDFSFVHWPVVVWAITSNTSSIYIEQVMARQTGMWVRVHAAVLFSLIWLLIGGLKLAYSREKDRATKAL